MNYPIVHLSARKAYIFFTLTSLLVIATITFERLITFQITNKTSLHCLGKANKQNKRIRSLTTEALQQFNENGYSKEKAIKTTTETKETKRQEGLGYRARDTKSEYANLTTRGE
jgi:hypothetical protein